MKEETQNEEKVMKEETQNEEKVMKEESKEAEHLERLQRLQAEFENYRKRTQKEKQETILNSNASLITELIVVLDNFELSLKNNGDKGVNLIYGELKKILEKQGLKEINAEGKFNPEYHEAVLKEEGSEDGKIVEILQKGYMLNDKLLRATKVKITTLTKE